MVYGSRSGRVHDDFEVEKLSAMSGDGVIKLNYNGTSSRKGDMEVPVATAKTGKSLKAKVLSRVFSEDYEGVKMRILDPTGSTIRRWNKIFFVACLFSLVVDPVFFYLPGLRNEACIDISMPLQVNLTIVRSLADVFYIIQIYIRFRTAYVAPSSRVFGRGELVIDPSEIALRYRRKGFWIDLLAALPLPQVLVWVIIPNLGGSNLKNMKNVLRFIVLFQYLPRLFLLFPLSSQILTAIGIATKTAWAGAAFNLILYVLASHILGASWYLLAIERVEACWRSACNQEMPSCQYGYFDCRSVQDNNRNSWFQSTNVTNLCVPTNNFYLWGIYGDALTHGVTTASFLSKLFYGYWWAMRNLNCLAQNLTPTVYVGELNFSILVGMVGLVLFALVVGNTQTYIQSTNVRLEEWRIKRTDTEQWMHHRQLSLDWRRSIRKYDQYWWAATRGVDEEALLKGLPIDLSRNIKRHLCLDQVRRVPLFNQMDEKTLDGVCERLKPALWTEDTFLVREDDPVNEMVFIIRGHLYSYTTNGGRTGFFNSCKIGPGDFCGEELLTWALDPRPSMILPSSTRTVKSVSEVEAFALSAEDLKFVAAQFRRLRSKRLRHTFRFHSHQWRTWAACCIQAAWRRFKKRKEAAELGAKEKPPLVLPQSPNPESILSACVAKWAASTRRGDSGVGSSLQKPAEPDFDVDDE